VRSMTIEYRSVYMVYANNISECVYGVSTQYVYTHMGYMEK
jgi:hypothetical protein